MPQLRQNIITGDWVVIAPERAKRPHDFIVHEKPQTNDTTDCPFCPSGPAFQTRYQDYDTEHTFLIPNKFPAFVEEGQHEVRSYAPESGFYKAKPAIGGHDVMVIKEHTPKLADIPAATLTDLLLSLQRRHAYYREHPQVEYVMSIYNHGQTAGASIEHPHAQIFASSIVPNHILKEKHGSERYYEMNSRCVYCELIEHEQSEKIRVLAESEQSIMFTFYAARFPFEIWLLPKQHQSQFESTSKEVLADIAQTLSTGLKMLDTTLHDPDLNFYIHSLPTTSNDAAYYHWHLEIAPRLSIWAGYELGSGTIIDVVSPEKAADFLRGLTT